MNKKLILFHVLIAFLLVIFIVMSITFYYLVPVAGSVMDYVRKAIEQLIGIIDIWS